MGQKGLTFFLAAILLGIGIARAETLQHTLELMRDAALAQPCIAQAEIDSAAHQLDLTDCHGETASLNPDNLSQMIGATTTDAMAKTLVQDFVVQMLKAMDQPHPTADAILAHVMPQVNSSGTMQKTLASTGSTDTAMAEDFLPGLEVGYYVDGDRSVQYVTRSMVDEAGITMEDLAKAARRNIGQRVDQAMVSGLSEKPFAVQIMLDNYYEGSLLLLPKIFAPLAESRGDLVLALPNRGVLLVTENSPDALTILRALVAKDFADDPNPVTQSIFLWHAGKITAMSSSGD